jgi:hypothetical protein
MNFANSIEESYFLDVLSIRSCLRLSRLYSIWVLCNAFIIFKVICMYGLCFVLSLSAAYMNLQSFYVWFKMIRNVQEWVQSFLHDIMFSCKHTVGKFSSDLYPPKYMKPEKLSDNGEKFKFILKILAKVKVTSSSSSRVSQCSPYYFAFLPACELKYVWIKQVTSSVATRVMFT